MSQNVTLFQIFSTKLRFPFIFDLLFTTLRAVPSRKLKQKGKPMAPLGKSDLSEPQISTMETKPSFFLDLP